MENQIDLNYENNIAIHIHFFLAFINNFKSQETPLITVVKLISAEEQVDFDVARNYININKVYKDIPENKRKSTWEEFVTFKKNLGKDKKFTNSFKYYDYNIRESINENSSKVEFMSTIPSSKIQSIIYHLELEKKHWIVTSIEYIKRL
ncbi:MULTISPECIES: hypothetical protein [unclassified Chryseobacterium]|uniref:hypothetical protein n=1 Tax=unclassified Chryseobacterium TaxID=2593645 RepID=UPI00100B6746|nr:MULTISPECIES: hypothetical protein [unclassified Chryseobacterium]RXM49626.1 hypothetical protein BOQ64_22755 [Chryseobacterium sp. CH25]RXM61520.1 hypothetical protein BOQ60_23345 [Chryseobacterium sp. CH1]